jgi:Fe-coproporphyrin III synthase
MFYKLDKKYAFRGWKKLPYALRRMDREGGTDQPIFMDKPTFMTALRCNGVEEVDEAQLGERERYLLQEMVRHGYAGSSEQPMGSLEPYQRYHVYQGPYLDSIHWSITGRCNYRCRHCLVGAPSARHPQPSLQDMLRIADQLVACGIRVVDITGGEPLVRDDFMDIVAALTDRQILIRTLYTNTALLTPELLDQMEREGQRPSFQISYDGYGRHDWLRGVPGAEDEARAACELLFSRGYKYSAAACVHRGNTESMRPLWRYLAQRGCTSLRVNSPQVLGEWATYSKEYALSQEEVWGLYRRLIGEWYEDGMPIGLELEGFFAGTAGKLDYKVAYAKPVGDDVDLANLGRCEVLRHSAYLSPEGRLVPCMGFSDTALGQSFPSILDGEGSLAGATLDSGNAYGRVVRTAVQEMLEDADENPECAGCEHLRRCLGGCMVEGVSANGNRLHHDERCCWFFKNVGEDGVRQVAEAAIQRFVPDGLAALQKEREENAGQQDVPTPAMPC